MKAMVLEEIREITAGSSLLGMLEIPIPQPGEREVQIKISVCGVCHTELDEIEGRTPPAFLPIVLGHQVVGNIIKKGRAAEKFNLGDRVGVAWIFWACGKCRYCKGGQENICDQFRATGRDVHGGYAEYMVAPQDFVYAIPDDFTDGEAAPMLCAGAIGYRSVRLSELHNGENLGLSGFGASAHLVLKLVKYQYPETRVYVFSRNENERKFALQLGAFWAGDFSEKPPESLKAIIDTTPAWKPVIKSLASLQKGGRLVINAIRKENKDKSALLDIQYSQDLWLEKEIKSVANVTTKDVMDFLTLASVAGIKPNYKEYPLKMANEALLELKTGKVKGAKVLRISN